MTAKGRKGRATAARPARVPRPHLRQARTQLIAGLEGALAENDAPAAAQWLHELGMRGEIGANVERALERIWAAGAAAVPDWLPMRHVQWLPLAYEIAARCVATGRGRSNIYLVLLDYADSPGDCHGVYVGMSTYAAAERFDQHKAGIRASGSVIRRGLEVLTGPVLHLQGIARQEATRIEGELAEALRAAGLRVRGGH